MRTSYTNSINGPKYALRTSNVSRLTVLALAAVVAFGTADLILTLTYARLGLMLEDNPLVVAIADVSGQAAAIAAFKILAMAFGCAILYRSRERGSAGAGSVIAAAAYLVVLLHWVAYASVISDVPPGAIDAYGGVLRLT